MDKIKLIHLRNKDKFTFEIFPIFCERNGNRFKDVN